MPLGEGAIQVVFGWWLASLCWLGVWGAMNGGRATLLIGEAALLWIACGVLTYGIAFAYLQREYPAIAEGCRRSDRVFAILIAVVGPIGLLVSFVGSGFGKHGLLFRAERQRGEPQAAQAPPPQSLYVPISGPPPFVVTVGAGGGGPSGAGGSGGSGIAEWLETEPTALISSGVARMRSLEERLREAERERDVLKAKLAPLMPDPPRIEGRRIIERGEDDAG